MEENRGKGYVVVRRVVMGFECPAEALWRIVDGAIEEVVRGGGGGESGGDWPSNAVGVCPFETTAESERARAPVAEPAEGRGRTDLRGLWGPRS